MRKNFSFNSTTSSVTQIIGIYNRNKDFKFNETEVPLYPVYDAFCISDYIGSKERLKISGGKIF
jgi:hypothetical protein